MSRAGGSENDDRLLGLRKRICRRDFLGATLLGSGSLLLGSLTPLQLLAQKVGGGEWDGPGGVGDYSGAHGNLWEVTDLTGIMMHTLSVDEGHRAVGQILQKL
jgi:hypothetical protein